MTDPIWQRELFIPGQHLFAIVDGAAAPDLFSQLHRHAPEQVCLYRGELPPDLAETAPYLVRLARDSRFTQWLFNQGWGNHWGIFAQAGDGVTLKELLHHFRTFLRVEFPGGTAHYFRYYDPRVLGDYLPTCDEIETRTVFGPVSAYLMEGTQRNTTLRFTVNKGRPYEETLRLD